MPKQHVRYGIIPLFLIIFIDSMGFGIIFPIFTPIFIGNATHLFSAASSPALRNFWFEMAIALYCLFMFLNSPVLGSLSDRYGRKKILLLSLSGLAGGFIFTAIGVWLNNLFLLLFGRIVAGATAGSYPIAQAAMVDLSENEAQKANRIGLVGIANGIGFSSGPIIGGLLLDAHLWHFTSYQFPLWVMVFLVLICLLMTKFLFHETFQGNLAQKINLFTSFKNLYDAFTLPSVRSFCLQLLLFMSGYAMFFSTLPIFITEIFHKSGTWIGYYLTYFGTIFTITLLFLLPKITGKISISRLIMTTLLTQIIFYLCFMMIKNEIVLWLIAIPIAISVPICYVSLLTELSNRTDRQYQGKMMGTAGSIAALTWGIGPLSAGIVGGIHFNAAFSGSAILLLLALLLFLPKQKQNVI